jgi:hypothetical protein
LEARPAQPPDHQAREDALKYLEAESGPAGEAWSPHVVQLFTYEGHMTRGLIRLPRTLPMRVHFSYSTCFNAVFFAFGFGGIMVAAVLLYRGLA